MSMRGKSAIVTGASMGIGRAIALALASEGVNLLLISRSAEKLARVERETKQKAGSFDIRSTYVTADVSNAKELDGAVRKGKADLGVDVFDILINNAGLALAAPAPFWQQSIDDIATMVNTNVSGMMFAAHVALNAGGMADAGRGIIVNVTSVTGLEVPPFPGEAVYHSSKAAQEAFTNVLRTELQGTNVRVVALRPGVVATNFHEQRVGYDKVKYDDFMEGIEALIADDVADAAVWMVGRREGVSIKALDVVPTAQRSLQVFDRTWNDRNGLKGGTE